MGLVQRDSFRITAISYLGVAIGYFNKVFLFTNFLSTEQVGLANLLITISVIYAQISAMGSYNITVRFFPMFHNKENGHHSFLMGLMGLAMAGFIFTTLFFVMYLKPFAYFYQSSSPLLIEYVLYIIPLAFSSLFYQLFESYLRSLKKNLVPSILHELVLRLLISISVLLFALGYISFPGFVIIYVAANCMPAVLIILYTFLIHQISFTLAMTPLLKRLGKIILAYGMFSMFNNLSIMLLGSIDSLMVAGMIDLGAAGIYTTMIFVTSVMLIPYRSMIKVTAPVVASFWRERNMEKMQELYKKASATNMVIGAGIFLLLWVNLDALFSLMPGEYGAGKMVFLFLGIGKLFDMAAGINGTILLMSKKFRYDLLFTIGLVGLAVLTNTIFIPLFGMNGAAVASMITIITFNILRIFFIKYHFNIQPFEPRQIMLPFVVLLVILIAGKVPMLPHILADVPLRTIGTGILFFVPVYFMKISPDINQLVISLIALSLKYLGIKR